jgi:two-component system CheB/CheR fusion protein
MPDTMNRNTVRYVLLQLATAVVYVVAAKMGLKLAFVAEQITVVWPATGIALSAVLLLGYGIWPAIAIGAFIANITTNAPAITSLGIAAGNTLEALVGAYLLNRFVGFRPSLERFRDFFGLIFFGAIASTTVSATIGVASLSFSGLQPWSRFGTLWGNWFVGDAMGVFIVAPLILTLFAADSRQRIRRRGLEEFGALIIVLVVVAAYVFSRALDIAPHYDVPDYAIFPVLIWAALRFGTCATAISLFITATIAVLGSVHGLGPYTGAGVNDNLISLLAFMSIAGATGFMMAIAETQRSAASEASRRSEDRYRSLVQASSQVIWTANAAGDVTEDLPSWSAFTGQTKEEVTGRGWGQKVHPDDIQRVREVWENSLATRTAHEVEFRVQAADGAYRHVLGRAVPILEGDGAVREWVGMLTDITEKKAVERELQEASRKKDEFLAMLSHELRNPLAPMRNAIEVLRLKGPPDPFLQSARDVIDRQLRHLTRLVDDLLDASRITQGKITLQKEKLELASIINRAVETSLPLIEERGQQLIVSVPPQPVLLSGDPTRLSQVLSNLLNNAVKYTEEGGRIWVSAKREGEEAVVRVRDSGVGIPEEVLPHVFDLFTQADRSLDRSQGGLGIGLTLVRNLVEMHGGRVQAKSGGPGKGSEFTVYLPALPSQSKAAEVPQASKQRSASCAGLRVLVVDDNVDSADTLAFILKLSGHDVRTAYAGDTALEEAGSFVPQVVVLDIGLPRMSGYEVARRLREQPEMKASFLIALTGYGQDEDRQRTMSAGFDHHLIKPVDPEKLQFLINSLTSN